ncbi:MAG: response regulator transcription factor [Alphaproteobacteria bacterium]
MRAAALIERSHLSVADGLPDRNDALAAPIPIGSVDVLLAGRAALALHVAVRQIPQATHPITATGFSAVLSVLGAAVGLDMVVLDARLAGLDGLKGIQRLRRLAPKVPLVVVCDGGPGPDVAAMLRAGAAGVLPASMSVGAQAAALQLVLAGERFAPPDLLLALHDRRADPEGGPMDRLSCRERQVAELIVQGCPNKEIARRLDLREITIKVYASAIFRKLGVRNRTAAAARLLDA